MPETNGNTALGSDLVTGNFSAVAGCILHPYQQRDIICVVWQRINIIIMAIFCMAMFVLTDIDDVFFKSVIECCKYVALEIKNANKKFKITLSQKQDLLLHNFA